MTNPATWETAKILLLGGAFVALYVLSRWSSRLNESQPHLEPLPEAPKTARASRTRTNVVPIDQRPQFHSSQALDEEVLRPVRIIQMYFSQFDFDPGPPDPKCFADELFVKLYDENTGYDWTESYYVATPQGLDEMLQRENWDYAYTDRVFVVRRYDARIMRQAVIEQLVSTVEKPSPPKAPEDRYV